MYVLDTIDEFKDGLKAAFSSAGRSKARKQLSAAHLQELLEEIDSLEKSSSASKSRSVDSDDARPVKRQRNSGESGAAIPIAQQVIRCVSYSGLDVDCCVRFSSKYYRTCWHPFPSLFHFATL